MTPAGFRIEIIPKPIILEPIAPKPIYVYVGGSGPPMAPITLLPEHDEDSWVIAQFIDYKKVPHYVIHPKDKPVVRKVVPKNDILSWVSPRVVEAFEYEEGIKRDIEEEELAREKERSKLTKNGKKRGRPFKDRIRAEASLAESIETETDTPDDGAFDMARQRLQPSLSQPSLSQPFISLPQRMELLFANQDTESTEDEGITGSMEPPPSKRSRTDMSEGPSSKTPRNLQESLSSPQTLQKNHAPTPSQQAQRSKSMAEPSTPRRTPSPTKSRTPQRSTAPPQSATNTSDRRALRDRSAQPFYGRQRSAQTGFPSRSASPAKSRKSSTPARHPTRSRNGTPSGGVQQASGKGWTSAPAKQSASTPQKRSKTSTPAKSTPSKSKRGPISTPAAESDDEDAADDKLNAGKQWKVIRLLDDKYRMAKRRRTHYYLTQWEGDYEPTWERSTNITSDLKEEYAAWKETEEGKAYKKKAGDGRKATPTPKKSVAAPSAERSVSRSSEDDQAQVEKQLGNVIDDLSAADNDEENDTDNAPSRLCADTADDIKRELSEEQTHPGNLPLAHGDSRSPYFDQQPAAVAGVEPGDGDEDEE
ncbi:hypothetical protein V495_02006 [Pseudogymnoascus sp. VKM F-4514 (FW-929)]|nr:hypothetical protein V495_02006 [Pseudogymnoascus sp. VKM F-4514 (FW-929)]KFY64677.1 hypothetical protein V497_01617 [Pseudogymnoascus sp. VKM F-4516 (FW-969)]